MASLFWHTSPRETTRLATVRSAISAQLQNHGYRNVEISELDIKASKGDTFTAIAHFKIGNHRFWEVAMTSSGIAANARTINNEVSRILRDEIHILDDNG